MMEVKQNTAVDLNDLLTSSKNGGTDEVDDAVMTDLSDRTSHDLVNCDLIKMRDETPITTEVENGDDDMASLINEVDVDLNTTVNAELEDALLAEDDVLPKIGNTQDHEPTSSATDDILAEKAETSNSTTSSNNVRDPGDDLDTLLSKINDIVEDCIENEIENTISNTVNTPDLETNKIVETEEEKKLNDSENSNLIEEENKKLEPTISDIGEILAHTDTTDNLIVKDALFSSDLPEVTQEFTAKSLEKKENNENKSDIGEIDTSTEANLNGDKVTIQSNSTENILENNINTEKTEESNAEVVQDNKITSNSNEIEGSKLARSSTTTTDNGEIMSSSEALDNAEIINTDTKNEEPAATVEKELKQDNDKIPTEDVITSGNGENEDSDDEIVFYVDKPPELEKPKDIATNSLETVKEMTTTIESTLSKKETISSPKKISQDDDVVLLLDDDDEEIDQIKKETSIQEISVKSPAKQSKCEESIFPTDASVVKEEKNIVIDNSDNARDDFATEISNDNEKTVNKTEVVETPDETNSNCSSSSNLLQEAKSVKIAIDEPTPDEAENEEEEEDGDVELVESELKDSESLEKVEDSEIAPPAKRIRLSEDGEDVTKKQESSGASDEVELLNAVEEKEESLENSEKENNFKTTHSTLKRSHDVIDIEAEEKSNDSNECSDKKIKTDNLKTDVISVKVAEIKDGKHFEGINKFEEDDKKSMKAVPSYEPIRLYPAPKFGVLKSELPMSLDFLKKFRKSFDNMTKQDLEELVLQKVVEAIIHRSEFSEMRELIEKQEKLINAHRTKISELSKQFRDLEMVHNRVVKDIEQRNSQFIMPVKITRAVGLQVYIPNKKSLVETTSSTTGTNVSSSPQRPVSSQASSTSSTSLTPPQRQFLSSQAETQQQRSTSTASSGPANTGIRRGCVQKITPIRPVPGANQATSAVPSAVTSATYRNTPNHPAGTQPRILNKNATTTSNATAIQRSRYLGSNQDGQRMPTQQQISRTPNNSQRVVANATTQSKPTTNVATTVQRRSEPLPSQTANSSTSSIVDNYINTLTHLTGGNTAVSITPAKPKEKAVIDLTDEDEAPAQPSSAQPVTQIPGTQVPRRILPAPNSSNSQHQYGRAAPSMARVPPANQMANNKNRQMSALQAQKSNSFTSISTPPGTSITRINVAPNATNVQRVKYNHPAPLPATPAQAFNPAWKLPPPRPTIRISNLDNGIVISWTMEESMDRHAECVSYQIYAYQETSGPPMVDSWRHVGDVKAMLLPMAVTLTQFQEGQRYYFAVRAVDCHQRYGPFSLPKTWS